jgi:hypothetical protein
MPMNHMINPVKFDHLVLISFSFRLCYVAVQMNQPHMERFLDLAISLDILAKRSMTAPQTIAPFPKL